MKLNNLVQSLLYYYYYYYYGNDEFTKTCHFMWNKIVYKYLVASFALIVLSSRSREDDTLSIYLYLQSLYLSQSIIKHRTYIYIYSEDDGCLNS